MRLQKVLLGLCLAIVSIAGLATAQAIYQPSTTAQTTIAECQVYPVTYNSEVVNDVTPMPDPLAAPRNVPLTSVFTFTIGVNQFRYLGWLNSPPSYSELEANFENGGGLGAGFNEAEPPIIDPTPDAPLNHRLELGDWVIGGYLNQSTSSVIWDWHIYNKSIMILPLHDGMYAAGAAPRYHIGRFVTARILAYKLSSTDRYLRFGLVNTDPSYTCFRYNASTTVGIENTFTPLMPFDATNPQLLWDFGDGTTSTTITPTHTYTRSGSYLVKLIHGQSHLSAAQGSITVAYAPPTLTPSSTPTATPEPTATATPEPTIEPTATLEPTATTTPEPTFTSTPAPSLTPEPSFTPTSVPIRPTFTPVPTPSPRWRIWPLIQ